MNKNDKFNIILFIVITITIFTFFITTLAWVWRNCNEGDKFFRDNFMWSLLKHWFNQTCDKTNSFKVIDLKTECINYIRLNLN